MKTHWFYKVLKITGRIGLPLFFGGVQIIGKSKTPKDGALIYAPNHQGAFMDAYLAGAFARKPVHFLTRADIFKKWTIPILKAMNMMPIYRMRDGIQNLAQNDQVFDYCFKLLSEEKALLIFPEGNHNIEYYLRPLSKGASRLALDARKQIDTSTKIYVIPTGINYFSHYRPLGKVIVKYGDPIPLEQYMELYDEHPQKAYNKFKQDLEEAMRKNMILVDKDENYEKKRDWIFQPKHTHLPFEKLKEMGDGDYYEERKNSGPGPIKRFFIALLAIFNLPPLLGLRKVISGIKDIVFLISIKYLVGTFFHILWWSLLFAVGVIWLGWEAGLLFAFTAILMAFARQSLIKY